jgi:hypothetical protein
MGPHSRHFSRSFDELPASDRFVDAKQTTTSLAPERSLRQRFTVAGLTALLMLERAAEGSEVEQAREAFWSWASSEQLLAPCSRDS